MPFRTPTALPRHRLSQGSDRVTRTSWGPSVDHGVDVMGMLRWGLLRYAWVVLAFALAVGALLPLLQAQRVDEYEARALVGAQGELVVPNADVLPKTAEDIFGNGTVAQETRTVLQLDEAVPVVPTHVELVTQQDALTFPILARSADPKRAQRAANTAAAIFALQMSTTQTGEYVVQSEADLPITPLPVFGSGASSIVIAVLGGALAGVGVVILLLIWRRPVLDSAAAEDATGVPVVGRVLLPRDPDAGNGGTASGIAAVARCLVTGPYALVLLASPAAAAAQRRALLSVLRSVLGEARQIQVVQGDEFEPAVHNGAAIRRGPKSPKARRQRELVIVDDPRPNEQAVRPDESMLLLVIPEGSSLASVRQAAEEHLDGGPAGVVLVRSARRLSRKGSRGGSGVRHGATPSTDDESLLASFSDSDADIDEPAPTDLDAADAEAAAASRHRG